MSADRTTLDRFLIDTSRRDPVVTEQLGALIGNVALACKLVAERLSYGAVAGVVGAARANDVQEKAQQQLGNAAIAIFRRAVEAGGHFVGIMSGETVTPFAASPALHKDHYLLAFDTRGGCSNIDSNGAAGSIFSVLRARSPAAAASENDFLQPGAQQVCAGYAIYGASTMLVITTGAGVQGFTLDPQHGEYVLTHSALHVPAAANEFAIDAAHGRLWEPAIKRYIGECLAGKAGPRQQDFGMHWFGSLAVEAHHILMRGGICLYPRLAEVPPKAGRLRLLDQANPIAFIIEQAGGCASTGDERILDLMPRSVHQRVSLIFGARDEVRLVEAYHREGTGDFDAPLFGSRGLFRASA
jgi:fructose-1,6-bisphosphatase I/sedoheptulose-1,7-bisphosphatase